MSIIPWGTAVTTAILAAILEYVIVIRSWLARWGATDEEARRALPGDELVAAPQLRATRAITIAAPAAAVWRALVESCGEDAEPSAAAIDPGRALVLRSRGRGASGALVESSRAFVLDARTRGRTRVMLRSRTRWSRSALQTIVARLVLEPAGFFADRRLLVRLRERAMRASRKPALPLAPKLF